MTKIKVPPPAVPPALDIAAPVRVDAMPANLRLRDSATGEEIIQVIAYDRDAGTVTRHQLHDGNLVREGDRYAIVTEQRDFRVEVIGGPA